MYRQTFAVMALGLAALLTACAVGPEEDVLSPSDPLYAQVKAQCGNNLVVRVLDILDDEAVCCLSFTAMVPNLHCMTSSGAVIDNPPTVAKIKEAAAWK